MRPSSGLFQLQEGAEIEIEIGASDFLMHAAVSDHER
jgi:hypothetical protein